MDYVVNWLMNLPTACSGVKRSKTFTFILLVLLAMGSSVQAQSDDPAFSHLIDIKRASQLKLSTIRYRFVSLSKGLAIHEQNISKKTPQKRRVQLNLFDDIDWMAVFEHVKKNEEGGYIGIGKIEDLKGSHIAWVERDGVVAATIRTLYSTYQVRYVGDGAHIIEEVDPSLFEMEAEPIPVYTDVFDKDDVPTDGDAGCKIDVLVFYTTAAKNGAGGNDGIWTRIQLGVAEANQAFSNSGITAQLNLKATLEIDYNETGNFSTDLDRLRNPSDGYLDSAHSLRDSYGADLVSLIVNSGSDCGLAYRMCNVGPGFEDSAFSVVKESCISPNYSFAHELGHNMGCHHAPGDSSSSPCISYNHSYGYRNYANNWRSIMAYLPGSRILHFSNPNVSYQGNSTGTSTQNNALTINKTCATVSNFREETNCFAKTAMDGDSETSSGDTDSNKESLLEIMYQFRNQVLRKSNKGQEYIDLYYQYATEASWLLLKDGTLRREARDLLSQIVPILGKVIKGEHVRITPEEVGAVENLLAKVAIQGSTGMQKAIELVLSETLEDDVLSRFNITVEDSKLFRR